MNESVLDEAKEKITKIVKEGFDNDILTKEPVFRSNQFNTSNHKAYNITHYPKCIHRARLPMPQHEINTLPGHLM